MKRIYQSMAMILSTTRLTLRQLTLADSGFIIQLVNTPGWLKYIGDRNIHTTEDAEAYLQNGPLKSYAENGFGLWMIELKKNGTAIGMCGLIRRPHLSGPDIGFALLPAYQGNGYTQEAVKAVINYAKKELALNLVLAIVMPENKAGITVLEKSGLKWKATFPASEKDPVLYLYGNE